MSGMSIFHPDWFLAGPTPDQDEIAISLFLTGA
jgi:hypothetical protein